MCESNRMAWRLRTGTREGTWLNSLWVLGGNDSRVQFWITKVNSPRRVSAGVSKGLRLRRPVSYNQKDHRLRSLSYNFFFFLSSEELEFKDEGTELVSLRLLSLVGKKLLSCVSIWPSSCTSVCLACLKNTDTLDQISLALQRPLSLNIASLVRYWGITVSIWTLWGSQVPAKQGRQGKSQRKDCVWQKKHVCSLSWVTMMAQHVETEHH